MALIERNDIIRELRKIPHFLDDENDSLVSLRDMTTLVMRVDAVDAAPVVHGSWKERNMCYVCSVCGAEYNDEVVLFYKGDANNGRFSGFEHCPHCAAKMDGNAE